MENGIRSVQKNGGVGKVEEIIQGFGVVKELGANGESAPNRRRINPLEVRR